MLVCITAILLASVSCRNNDDNPSEITTPPKDTTTVEPNGKVVLTLSATEITIGIGETKKLSARSSLTNMETSGVLWISDNPSVASVDTSGNVKGISDGSAIITVSTIDGTSTATCAVTVTSKVTGINIHESQVVKEVGDTFELTYSITPENAANSAVIWTSNNESVATVSKNGVIHAIADGNASIMIKTEDGGFTDFCTVTVITPVKGITLQKTSYEINKGISVELQYTITPANATNKSVVWTSSNDSVAYVTNTGKVTATGAGSATITVTTSNGLSASCIINVKSGATGVTISHEQITIKKGEEWTLVAEVLPADASIRNVTWSSSDSSVATVTQSGIVSARKVGKTVITVRTEDGGFTKTCMVDVINPLSSIVLDKSEVVLSIYDDPIYLIPTFEPFDADNISDARWSSNNSAVATVDANGMVTAKGAGVAVITLSTGDGIFATCTVTVPSAAKVPVESITVEKRFVVLKAGEKHTPIVKVLPEDAGDKTYVLVSSNPSVVRIEADGSITALSKGTAIITVSSVSDPEISQTISVEVTELTQAELESAIAQYNSEMNKANQDHQNAIDSINNSYSYLTGLKSRLDAYETQKAALEKNIADYQAALVDAENAGNVELINYYTDLIDQANKAINDLNTNYPTYSAELSIYNEEIVNYNSAIDAQNKLFNDEQSRIKYQYTYILSYISA